MSATTKPATNADAPHAQTDTLRWRINYDAKAMLRGQWDKVKKKPYKPKEFKEDKTDEWRHQVQRQNKISAWMAVAHKLQKGGTLEESRYRAIMEMRKDSDFVDIVKKFPAPNKPASMSKPAWAPAPVLPNPPPARPSLPVVLPVTLPANYPNTLKRSAAGDNTGIKQEVIDVDKDDEEPDLEYSDYEPEEEAAVQREKRANKRQRTGDSSTQLKQSHHEEDLQFQLEESRLKSQLEEVRIRRKMATLRRRNEDSK